jgi:hypothetical protein
MDVLSKNAHEMCQCGVFRSTSALITYASVLDGIVDDEKVHMDVARFAPVQIG